MALNPSGILDLFMTGQRPNLTMEQEESLIVDEIMKNAIRVAGITGENVGDIFYERYMREISRRARTFNERKNVTMVKKVDFAKIPSLESLDEESDNEASKPLSERLKGEPEGGVDLKSILKLPSNPPIEDEVTVPHLEVQDQADPSSLK